MFITTDIYDDHNHQIAIGVSVAVGWGEGQLEVGYNPNQNYTGNHIDAARKFLEHMDWKSGKWLRFPFGMGGYAFIDELSLAPTFDLDAENKP